MWKDNILPPSTRPLASYNMYYHSTIMCPYTRHLLLPDTHSYMQWYINACILQSCLFTGIHSLWYNNVKQLKHIVFINWIYFCAIVIHIRILYSYIASSKSSPKIHNITYINIAITYIITTGKYFIKLFYLHNILTFELQITKVTVPTPSQMMQVTIREFAFYFLHTFSPPKSSIYYYY